MATAVELQRMAERIVRKAWADRDRGGTIARRRLAFPGWFRRVFAEYLTSLPARHHGKMLKELKRFHRRRGQKKVRLAPRGFAKTVIMQAYVCYCAGYGLEWFILWLSNTKEQAVDNLSIVRDVIEFNPEFRRLCPAAAGRGPMWRQNRVVLRNGVRVDAYGALQNIRGRRRGSHRPSLIVGDDLQKTEQMESGALRRRTNEWWDRDVEYVGGPKTNYYVTDTAIHPDAVSYRLAKKTPGWDAKIYKALVTWPSHMHLWREWKDVLLDHSLGPKGRKREATRFYRDNKDDMDAGAQVLWPDRFPLYDLMNKWATSGEAAFLSEFQNNPTDPSRVLWTSDCFDHKNIFFDEWPKDLAVRTLGIDASLGKHDYFANVFLGATITGGGENPEMVLYVDAQLETRDPEYMITQAIDYAVRFKPDGLMCEDMAFQDLLKPVLRRNMERKSIWIPIYPDQDSTNKLIRIRRLGEYIAPRRVRFKRRSAGAALLLEHLRYFPTAEFDDGPDGFEKALRCIEAILDDPKNPRNEGSRRK